MGHVVRGQLLRTFPLQSISLRQTGYFIEQKRNTKVCKDLPDVRGELERNSYTIVGWPDFRPPPLSEPGAF